MQYAGEEERKWKREIVSAYPMNGGKEGLL
jgi:hypothetical protein